MHQWREWQQVGDRRADTIAAADYRGRRYLFASDVASASGGSTATGVLHLRVITPATPAAPESDTGWEVFPVDGTTDAPVTTAVFGNKLFVFAKGVDDRKVYLTSTEDGTTWREWKGVLPFNGTTSYQPSAAVLDNRLYATVRRWEDNKYLISSTADGKEWTPWTSPFPALPPLGTIPNLDLETLKLTAYGGAVPLVAHDGRLHAITADNDWNILVSSSANGSSWSSWTPIGGVGTLLAGASFDGGLLVFSTTYDEFKVHVKGSSDGVKWNHPSENLGSPPQDPVAQFPAVVRHGAAITVYIVGLEGLWSRTAIYEVDSPPAY